MSSKGRQVFKEYAEAFTVSLIAALILRMLVIQAFRIPTGSMKDTLLVGDFLLVNKFVYDNGSPPLDRLLLPRRDIKRNDIIVFKYPNELSKDYVKRVIGLPGEKFEVRDKQVYINGQPLREPFKVHSDTQVFAKNGYYNYEDTIRDNFGPVTIPPGHLFAMGDNRDQSSDSRYWGFVPLSYVKGRPWIIYFSYAAERDAYLKTSVRDRLKKLVRFIPKARWNRMLKIIR